MKIILHSDLNNFFASVECLHNPKLRNLPVAVCGSPENRHGIVLAKNNIAKSFGVKTASTIWQAKSICPNLVTVKPNYHLYVKYSRMVKKIYSYYTDNIESFGIDECWLDVTQSQKLFGDGETIAYKIKERVKEEIGITCSIGVSYNKIFAKLGSDMKKPDAVTVIMPQDIETKIFPLPCEELLYVGRKTKQKLNNLSIYTIGDLAATNPKVLETYLGKWGKMLWQSANGLDSSPVHKTDDEHLLKSVGNSITAPQDLVNDDDVRILLLHLSESVGKRLRQHGLIAKTICVVIKDSNLKSIDRQSSLGFYTNSTMQIYNKAFEIFKSTWDWSSNVRLLGVRAIDICCSDEFVQTSLFCNHKHQKLEEIDGCIDKIRDKYGFRAVKRGLILKEKVKNYTFVDEEPFNPFGKGM
jgi:DNA polymerase-4